MSRDRHPAGAPAGLVADVVVERGAFRLVAAFAVRPGEIVALLGPNGAGKTTLLRTLAGLEPLTSGRIDVDGVRWDDPGAGVLAAPERRRTGYLPQQVRLFEHLDLTENVAFGQRAAGVPRRRARAVAADWLGRLGLDAEAARLPSAVSGGQAQRAGLARALACDPSLVLLDEPLAAQDVATRSRVRHDLAAHLRSLGRPAVVATHDLADALLLTDRALVLEAGRVVQDAPPAEVARRPGTTWAAHLAGANVYRGTAHGGVVELDGGGRLVVADAADGQVVVTVPPSAVALHPGPPAGSPRNAWPVTVTGVHAVGQALRVAATGTPSVLADVTPGAVAELGLVPGREVWAAVKATEARADTAP